MKKISLILTAIAAAATLAVVEPAWAGVSISCSSGHMTVTVTDNGTSVTIVRSGSNILANGASCGATVGNTTLITVNGGAGRQNLTIDFSGGMFASSGTTEIKFTVTLSSGTDQLTLNGASTADKFRVGTTGINFNGDTDSDITLNGGVEGLVMTGNDGADNLSASGALGTGVTYPKPVFVGGDAGNDTIVGGSDRDYISGGGGDDHLWGGMGQDSISDQAGNDSLYGQDDNDALYPGPGNDQVSGGDGGDYLASESVLDGKDVFSGGAGRDNVSYYGRPGAVHVLLDNLANDGYSVEADNVKTDVENVAGGGGNDTITGSSADNNLDGGNGADIVRGGLGADAVYGGFGDAGGDVLYGGGGTDYLYGDAGPDRLYGDDESDLLYPGPGNDKVYGGDGSDSMYPESTLDGADLFSGGYGQDRVDYTGRVIALKISLDNVANDGQLGEGDNVLTTVEHVTGGQKGDTIIGSGADNNLDGWGGPDLILAGGGDDSLTGGYVDAAADILHGGGGNDYMTGGNGLDKLYGEGGSDSLSGGGGNDVMDAGSGDDSLNADYGSDGTDQLYGRAGTDSASYYRPVAQKLTLDDLANDGKSLEKDNIHSDIENVYGGTAADQIVGSSGRNYIYGNGGNDTIDGMAGADSLSGSDGGDKLTGGDGEDYLYGDAGPDAFAALDGGTDYVYGGTGTDTILSHDAFDVIAEVP